MKVLLVVDAQNDFMPGGSLAVNEGDQIVPVINKIRGKFDKMFATRDWHPEKHCSFAQQGGPWPVHCVQNTQGSELHKELTTPDLIVDKGLDLDIDSYSAFFDNERKKATGLTEILKVFGVTELYVAGLALDYCVKFTALDAVSEGFKTILIEDCTRPVNVNPDDGAKALEEMKKAGITVVKSEDLLKQ